MAAQASPLATAENCTGATFFNGVVAYVMFFEFSPATLMRISGTGSPQSVAASRSQSVPPIGGQGYWANTVGWANRANRANWASLRAGRRSRKPRPFDYEWITALVASADRSSVQVSSATCPQRYRDLLAPSVTRSLDARTDTLDNNSTAFTYLSAPLQGRLGPRAPGARNPRQDRLDLPCGNACRPTKGH